MILIKSLAVLLLIFILAHFGKKFFGQQTEGFETEAGTSANEIKAGTSANEIKAGTSANEIKAGTLDAVQITSASQKAQQQAQQLEGADTTVDDHKKITKDSNDMQRIKLQIAELVNLSNEAKAIDESFKTLSN